MHPDIWIVRMERRLGGLSMRLYVPNTLTCQYGGTSDAPQGHALWPHYMESWLDTFRPYAISTSPSEVLESFPTSQYTQSLRRCVKSCQVSDTSTVIGIRISALATISDWIRLTVFDLILLSFLPFDLTYVKRIYYQFETHHSSPIPVMLWVVPHWTGCLQKNQYLNHRIFHNYESLNWFLQRTL